jgi:tetratricopeptide (TPR) repeat protein
MKLFLILISASLLTLVLDGSGEKWPDALSRKYFALKKASQKTIEKATNRATGSSASENRSQSRTADPYPGTPEEKAMLEAYHQQRVEARLSAQQLIVQGRPVEARALLEAFLSAHPTEESIVPTLADACFRLDLNQRAYDLLAPFARTGAMGDTLLRASLAAARGGEVYSGQKQYCVNVLAGGDDYPELKEAIIFSSVPSGNAARDIELVSLLALGTGTRFNLHEHNQIYYLSQALQIDPGNSLANWTVGDVHLGKQRYAQAVVAYERALVRAREPMKRIIQRQLETARYMRDN